MRWVWFLLACFLLLAIGLRAQARSSAPSAAVVANLPTGDCHAPCRYTIRPSADNLLLGVPQKNSSLRITPTNLRIGDVIAHLGTPAFMMIRFNVTAREIFGERMLELHYSDYNLRALVELPSTKRLSPHIPIFSLHYDAKAQPRPVTALDWIGFQVIPSTRFLPRKEAS